MDPELAERALSKLEAQGPQALVPPEESATTHRSSRKQSLPFGALGKIGFLTHIPELINHYRCIWEHLGAGRAEIVNAAEGRDAEIIATTAHAEGVDCIALADRLRSSQRYACLVSNHPVQIGTRGVPLIKRLGEVNARLMYAVGKASWNLSGWNALYDAVLCFGPYHVQSLESVTGAHQNSSRLSALRRFFSSAPAQARIVDGVWVRPRAQDGRLAADMERAFFCGMARRRGRCVC